MKRLFLVLFVLVAMNGYLMSQNVATSDTHEDLIHCLPEMGMDSLPILNDCESKYMNYCFQSIRGSFDFSGKNVAFFTGSGGGVHISKTRYFNNKRKCYDQIGIIPNNTAEQLIVFNQEESIQFGYDAVVISASHKWLSKKEVIKRLNKRTKRSTK
ncbi:MAG: hypothetical protein II975_08850 [Bacteroidales bacterium]|nr:hypothetical protein [Bacteroidales bacterium]